MSTPRGFSWLERPILAGMARPQTADEMHWLRQQGIEVLISLTEDRLPRDWCDDAGLLVFHEPLEDMEPPTQDQLDRCVSAVTKAIAGNMGVAVHCGAGLGRTGVVLAAYLVTKGLSAANAISRVRRLRPNSIETDEQVESVERFARRQRRPSEPEPS